APLDSLEPVLWALEERALIYQERAVPEEEYSFQHVLAQETIYRSIPRRRRAALHQQVAEAMEALYAGSLDEHTEALAYHFEQSGADEKAAEYLLKSGEKARRAYHNEAAAAYFQRALGRIDAPQSRFPNPESKTEGRLAALRGLGQVYYSLGRLSDAEKCFR